MFENPVHVDDNSVEFKQIQDASSKATAVIGYVDCPTCHRRKPLAKIYESEMGPMLINTSLEPLERHGVPTTVTEFKLLHGGTPKETLGYLLAGGEAPILWCPEHKSIPLSRAKVRWK